MSANMFGYAARRVVHRRRTSGRSTRRRCTPATPTVQVVDFAGAGGDFTRAPGNARLQTGTPPAGSPEYFVSTEQFLNALSIYKFHVDWDNVSTSTFTGPDTPLAPDLLAELRRRRTRRRRPTPRTCSRSARWRRPSTRTSAAPSRSGSTTPSTAASSPSRTAAATNAATRRSAGTRPTSRAARSRPTSSRTRPTIRRRRTRSTASCRALAVDRAGDLAVGYTKSNATTNPQIKYAGRLAGDPLNTFGQAEQTLIDGTGAQTGNCGPSTCIALGRLQRHGARPQRLRVLDDRRVLRDHRPEPPDAHRLVPLPELHPGRQRHALGHRHRRRRTRSPAPPSRSATGRRRRTGAATTRSRSRPGPTRRETAAKPGFDTASAATLVVPDGGTLTKNFTLNAAAQSGCFTDNSQSTFQRGVPSDCDLTSSPGNVMLSNPPTRRPAEPDRAARHRHGFTSTSWAGQTFTAGGHRTADEGRLQMFCNGCTRRTRTSRSRSGRRPADLPTGADLASATIAGYNSGATGDLHGDASPRRRRSPRARSTRCIVRTVSRRGRRRLLLDPLLAEHLRRRPARHVGQQRRDLDAARLDARLQLPHLHATRASRPRHSSSPR